MTEAIWGMRFNEYPDHQRVRKGQRPEGCLEWFESQHIRIWQEQGLILWNNINKRIESLRAPEALKILSDLNSLEDWKSQGVSVTRLFHQIPISTPTHSKRKKSEPEPEVEKPKGEDLYREVIHLPPEAGHHLIEWHHKKELQDFDFGSRSFHWESDSASRMVCRFQTAEGRIWLAKDKVFWNTCVKREGHAGHSHFFVKIAEAVEWILRGSASCTLFPMRASKSWSVPSLTNMLVGLFGKNLLVCFLEVTPAWSTFVPNGFGGHLAPLRSPTTYAAIWRI